MTTRILVDPRRSNVDLSLEFNSFNYTDYGMCDYEQLIDPNNNLYNDIQWNLTIKVTHGTGQK